MPESAYFLSLNPPWRALSGCTFRMYYQAISLDCNIMYHQVALSDYRLLWKESKVKIVRRALRVFLWTNEALNKHPTLLLLSHCTFRSLSFCTQSGCHSRLYITGMYIFFHLLWLWWDKLQRMMWGASHSQTETDNSQTNQSEINNKLSPTACFINVTLFSLYSIKNRINQSMPTA